MIYFGRRKKMTYDNKGKLDERQSHILSKGMAAAAVFNYVFEIILIIVRLNQTGDISRVYLNIGSIAAMLIIMTSYYVVNNHHDKSIEKAVGNNGDKILDERKRKLIIESLAASTFIAYFYKLLIIIFRFIKNRNFTDVHMDIAALLIMFMIISIFHAIDKEYSLPKSFLGKTLPIGKSRKEKRLRYLAYIYDAIFLTIIFLIIDIRSEDSIFLLGMLDSKILLYGANSTLRFILFFIIKYLWGEYNIKKHDEYYRRILEDE